VLHSKIRFCWYQYLSFFPYNAIVTNKMHYKRLVFPGLVQSGFLAIFGWTRNGTGPLSKNNVKRPDQTNEKPQKTGLNQLQPVSKKTGPKPVHNWLLQHTNIFSHVIKMSQKSRKLGQNWVRYHQKRVDSPFIPSQPAFNHISLNSYPISLNLGLF